MSKTIAAGLKSHMEGETTTLAVCWTLDLTDGTTLGFTNHNEDLVVSGVTYNSARGISPTDIDTSGDLAVDNLDVTGLIGTSGVTEADLLVGRYNHAELHLFMVNYADSPITDILKLRRGWMGNIELKNGRFIGEIRGMTQRLQQQVGIVTSPLCRVPLGSTQCGVDIGASPGLLETGSVTGVTNKRTFADSSRTEADDVFNFGLLTWTSGNNNGLSMEVKGYVQSTGTFTLTQPMPSTIQAGDTYQVYPGCDKRLTTCINKFNNVINFRGEPYVPQGDQGLSSAGGTSNLNGRVINTIGS